MKSKPSIWFLVSALVSFLLIAGSAALLVLERRKAGDVDQRVARQRAELRMAYAREPFPSVENVAQERENTRRLREWHARLVAEAGKGQMAVEERSPSAFMALLGQVQPHLLAEGQRNPGRVPAGFGFGFDRYFVTGGKLPSPEHVPRLTQQLKIMESLTRILFEENVSRVITMHRELFEGGPSAGENEGVLLNPQAGLTDAGGLYGRFHFALDFEAKESALIAVLNRLARHEMFTVVTRMEIVKLGEDVRPAERPAPTPATVDLLPEVLARQQRLVCGLALETPMRVKLNLDVYQFEGVVP